MSDVPMRGVRPSGVNTCTRAMSDDGDCDAPATWHIWWRADDITSAACDQHHQEALARDWEMRDAHPFGGVCLMPGTHWQFSSPGEAGFCFMPISLDDELEMHEPTTTDQLKAEASA